MTLTEFSNQFDVLYNNITSNQAPGLNEYEKSVFLTKAQNEIVKNYFTANSKGNNIGQGFDDSAKRQADFSCLMKTAHCDLNSNPGSSSRYIYAFTYNNFSPATTINSSGSVYAINNGEIVEPYNHPIPASKYTITSVDAWNDVIVGTGSGVEVEFHGLYSRIHYVEGGADNSISVSQVQIDVLSVDNRIDPRSSLYIFPDSVFIVINEALYTSDGSILQVVPLRYDEYLRLMSKPFKRPLKNQAWRLINSGTSVNDVKNAEIITNLGVSISTYMIRYIRKPEPIILANLDGLTIEGKGTPSECELDTVLHEDILQRAVELAKVAWTATGNDNAQMVLQAGQRSE